MTMNPRSTYDSDPIAFDRAKVLSDLGISSLEDVQIIGVNSDGSYRKKRVLLMASGTILMVLPVLMGMALELCGILWIG